MEELGEELEEQRELATNTLQELETLNIKYRENLKKVEELQMNVSFSVAGREGRRSIKNLVKMWKFSLQFSWNTYPKA